MTVAAVGGQAPAAPQQPPTFRVEARAIEVDASVTDRDGRFVRGLTQEDFELFEAGQPQEISAFTLVDVPLDVPGPQPGPQKDRVLAVDPDVVTNAVEGRIYAMLLDSPGLAPLPTAHVQLGQMFRYAQMAAIRFVDEALGPNDVMAVVHVQGARRDAQSFTRHKGLLRASIERLTPDFAVEQGQPYCDIGRIRNSYEVLAMVSERLGAQTGRRKAILWVNGRVPFDPADRSECGLPAAVASSLDFMRRDALRAATRNNVAIYPIDGVGLAADPREGRRKLLREAALRAIAEDTGGEAIVNTNNFSPLFERIVRANSSYYLLGYRPAIEHRDGRFHDIQVRVRRPGLSVRTRRGYTAPGPDTPAADARPVPNASPEAGAALVKALPLNGLGLELFLAPFKAGAGGTGSVVLGATIRGVSAEPGAEPRLEISTLAIDPQGNPGVYPPVILPATREGGAGLPAAGTVRITDRLVLPPGRHEVRVAAHQPGGATGSVVGYVEVPDYARAPLSLSGLVVASADAGPPSLLGDATLRAILAADPTTDRRFGRHDTLTVYVEAYTDARTRIDDGAITAALTTALGAHVRSETTTRAADEPGRAGFTIRVPLADVTPGDYVLTIEAKVARRTAVRQLGFAVLP